MKLFKTKHYLSFVLIALLVLLSGCGAIDNAVDKLNSIADPTERGLILVAAAIVVHGFLTEPK